MMAKKILLVIVVGLFFTFGVLGMVGGVRAQSTPIGGFICSGVCRVAIPCPNPEQFRGTGDGAGCYDPVYPHCCVFPTPTPIPCVSLRSTGELLRYPACAFQEIGRLTIYIIDMGIIAGAILALGALIYGGAQYTWSVDDPEKREKAQKTIQWAVVGLLIAAAVYLVMAFAGVVLRVDVFSWQPQKIYANNIETVEEQPLVQLSGKVRHSTSQEILPGTEVALFWFNQNQWELWPAQNFRNQRNPYLADSFGQYQFLVPPGQYYLNVQKNGFFEGRLGPVTVETTPVQVDIPLKAAPTVWVYLIVVGVPMLVGTMVYFSIRRIILWRKKEELRQQLLREVRKENNG